MTLSTLAVLALPPIAVKAVMWRLAWQDRRPVSPRRKRGQRSRWWLLAPVVLVGAVVVWWCGSPEAARWMIAGVVGVPFLFAGERFWRGIAVEDDVDELMWGWIHVRPTDLPVRQRGHDFRAEETP